MPERDDLSYSTELMGLFEKQGLLNKVGDGWVMPPKAREYIRGLKENTPDEDERIYVKALKNLLALYETLEKQ